VSAPQPTAVFDACFTIVVGEEGGYDNSPADPGNWTGGARGSGVLKGTNWGISAAAYPTYNIQTLTKGQAQTIYFGDYWVPTSCPALPVPLALMVFDAAVNNGQERAREWLQAALGVAADGVIGPETLAALAAQTTTPAATQSVCAELLARRIDFMGGLKTWQQFGLGWARRLAALPYYSLTLPTAPSNGATSA